MEYHLWKSNYASVVSTLKLFIPSIYFNKANFCISIISCSKGKSNME